MAAVQLADVFVEMADTLVDDFDVIDFLRLMTERCVQLLRVSAAGLLLTDGRCCVRGSVDAPDRVGSAAQIAWASSANAAATRTAGVVSMAIS
jgi:hypothetical protein